MWNGCLIRLQLTCVLSCIFHCRYKLYNLGIFIGLTIFALTTKKDFTTPRGIAIVCLCGLIEFILWVFISPNSFIYDIYLALGIIVFGIYLVIDTQLIVGGKNGKLTMDDYVVAAMFLYIDIIQIFIRILLLLLRSNRR